MGKFNALSLNTNLKVSHPVKEVGGQLVLWKRSATVENAVGSAAHHKGKTAGRQKKQQVARRHELRYQKKLTEVVKSFSEGYTVGMKNN